MQRREQELLYQQRVAEQDLERMRDELMLERTELCRGEAIREGRGVGGHSHGGPFAGMDGRRKGIVALSRELPVEGVTACGRQAEEAVLLSSCVSPLDSPGGQSLRRPTQTTNASFRTP